MRFPTSHRSILNHFSPSINAWVYPGIYCGTDCELAASALAAALRISMKVTV